MWCTFCFCIIFAIYILFWPSASFDAAAVEENGGKWLQLQDGRYLEYFEYRSRKYVPEKSHVVLFFHGTMNSGYSCIARPRPTWEELGLLVICPSLPGWGWSDLHAGRVLADYGNDIQQLLDVLELDKVAVAGSSLGGIHSAAVAATLPNRVTHVGIFGSLCPLVGVADGPGRGLWWRIPSWIGFRSLLGWVSSVTLGLANVQTMLERAMPEEIEQLKAFWGPNFNNTMDSLTVDARRAHIRGWHGNADTSRLVWSPWGFTVNNITTPRADGSRPKCLISSGGTDTVNPPFMQEYLIKWNPSCKVQNYTDEGHLHLMMRGGELMEMLLSM